MKSNILAFFFTIGSIVMAVFIVWFYNMSDRVEPEMRFSSYDLTYNGDTRDIDLLNGVAAYDAVDGDITDRIVVEKTILNEEQSSAVVYYAVSDRSGNVTKQSRVFPADIASIRSSDNVLFSTNQSIGEFSEDLVTDGSESGFSTEGFEVTNELPDDNSGTESSLNIGNEGEDNTTSGAQESESTGN
ncbi:hypothetical protein [Butyrivibrio sp. VCD2006]|uniref:hypothetical protein n=1 Tax=Butyrivibrio sp. VCD2006 TaxID=1280664 RepID=UPI000568C530|nr:hypothetical protein [Butyrivibrio sp. VCD2006]